MSTTKRRLNISLEPDIDQALTSLAKRDKLPQATKASHLLRLALEIEEDLILGSIAQKRDRKDTKFISHLEAWK